MDEILTGLSLLDNIEIEKVGNAIQKIAQFQAVVQKTLKKDHDFGEIPGTNKPTLLKPGGEKICMIFGLNPEYEFLNSVENYKDDFFSYNVRCTLYRQGMPCAQGVGSCNSKEKKYRYVNVSKIPEGYIGPSEAFTDRYGRTMYKIENPDVCSLVNTILKMAKKRAFVDAVLQVASLSDIFTQDIEDMQEFMAQEKEAAAANMTPEEAGAIKVSFGKYKGKSLREIYIEDRGYFEWLTENARDAVVLKACEIMMAALEAKKAAEAEPVGPREEDEDLTPMMGGEKHE